MENIHNPTVSFHPVWTILHSKTDNANTWVVVVYHAIIFFSKDHYHAIMVLQTAGHSSAHCTPRHADRSPCFPATEARLYHTPLLTKKDARFCVTSTWFCQIVTAPCSCSLVLRGGNQGSGWVLTVTGTAWERCCESKQPHSQEYCLAREQVKLWQVRRRKLRRCPRPFCFERKNWAPAIELWWSASKNTIFRGESSICSQPHRFCSPTSQRIASFIYLCKRAAIFSELPSTTLSSCYPAADVPLLRNESDALVLEESCKLFGVVSCNPF